ncbi:MAG: M48 family metallopeptidase [Turicibacter sp.]|nr:M48 family metallopeptidase [Turicibacter sp.]
MKISDENTEIEVEIRKKKIKNLHLYVKPPNGKVTVSAPLSMSDAAIKRFLQTKLAWIKKQIAKFAEQPHQTAHEYISGEFLYIWGERYFLQVEEIERLKHKSRLILQGNHAILTIGKTSTVKQRELFVREWYRTELKLKVSEKLPKWEQITGLKASDWQTKHMKTRWGTCNIKTGKIWLNVQLAKKPPECLEYVILHELCHLVVRKHNRQFNALMDKFMPSWREIQHILNGHDFDFKNASPCS